MRLSYLADGSPDCPLLVLIQFTPKDVAAIQLAARALAIGQRSWARFDEHLDAGSSARLLFRVSARDTGILATPPSFECTFTRSSWSQVEGLLEPFLVPESTGYQWLDRSGVVSLLISRDGKW